MTNPLGGWKSQTYIDQGFIFLFDTVVAMWTFILEFLVRRCSCGTQV